MHLQTHLAVLLAVVGTGFSQTDSSRSLVRVKTAQELQAAINDGEAAHVHVTQHIDLDELKFIPISKDDDEECLLKPSSTLRSITVRRSVATEANGSFLIGTYCGMIESSDTHTRVR